MHAAMRSRACASASPACSSVYNALSVIACACALGISLDDCSAALDTAKPVKGRAEVLETDGDYTILIDYAVTPDAIDNILTTVREFAPSRLVFLFGCGGDRDKTKRPIMGRIGAELADIPIVTSDNPRSENPETIVEEVEAGVKEGLKPGQHHEVIVNRRDAIYRAVELAQTNDIIVIAGKGHETYQILNDGTIHFDDREEARNAVHALHRGDK